MKVGIKSTALRFGDSTKTWISGFGVACISSLALCGYNADIGIYLILPHSRMTILTDCSCLTLDNVNWPSNSQLWKDLNEPMERKQFNLSGIFVF